MTTDEQVKAIRELDRLHLLAKRSRSIADVARYQRHKRRLEHVMNFRPAAVETSVRRDAA